jgi:hypothetical protein
MIDMRLGFNERLYISTFIIGNRYVSVRHLNKAYGEIIEALEGYLGELKKPFLVIAQAQVFENDSEQLIEKELIDIDMVD